MRLIDADTLLEKVEKIQPWDAYLGKYAQGIRHCMELVSLLIQDAPTIESERETGEWLMDGEKCGELMWRCSECKVSEAVPTATSFVSGIAYPQWKFCPNCGSYNGGENEG